VTGIVATPQTFDNNCHFRQLIEEWASWNSQRSIWIVKLFILRRQYVSKGQCF
jgi:hypothetical protein